MINRLLGEVVAIVSDRDIDWIPIAVCVRWNLYKLLLVSPEQFKKLSQPKLHTPIIFKYTLIYGFNKGPMLYAIYCPLQRFSSTINVPVEKCNLFIISLKIIYNRCHPPAFLGFGIAACPEIHHPASVVSHTGLSHVGHTLSMRHFINFKY